MRANIWCSWFGLDYSCFYLYMDSPYQRRASSAITSVIYNPVPWTRAVSFAALAMLKAGLYLFLSNYFTPQLLNKHSPCPCFPPFLHMKEANQRCDRPLFTSDPANTRITTSIPAPQPLNAFPQLGGCFSPCRWQMRGQGAVRPPC